MDTTTATPLQIDTQLAELFAEMARADSARDAALTLAHRAAGDKQVRGYGRRAAWGMTDEAAIAAIAELDTDLADIARRDLERAVARMAAAEAQAEPLHAEYARRPWSRFFSVPGGHIHKDNRLSCNRRPDTDQRLEPGAQRQVRGRGGRGAGAEHVHQVLPHRAGRVDRRDAPQEPRAGRRRAGRRRRAGPRHRPEADRRPGRQRTARGRHTLRTVRSAEIAAVDAPRVGRLRPPPGEPNEPYAARLTRPHPDRSWRPWPRRPARPRPPSWPG
jgi:hypothetical protein